MLQVKHVLVASALAFLLAGCHLLYVPDVQQGNWLKKKDVEQLQPGLTKRQVLVLLGTPSIATPFNQNRWDYVSSFSRRGRKATVHTLTLTFNNDILVRTEGDFFAQSATQMLKDSKRYHVNYPVNDTKGDKDIKPKSAKGSDNK